MKNRFIAIILIVMVLLTGCKSTSGAVGVSENPENAENTAESVGMGNPWIETDEAGVLEATGFEMRAPIGATNVSYQVNESLGIAQMIFSYGDPEQEFTYRMKSVSDFEDISGLYYDWTVEDDIKVSWCEGKSRRAITESEMVDSCLWCDIVPGVMYSLSTSAPDLDGFDILAIADAIFVPTQGDS